MEMINDDIQFTRFRKFLMICTAIYLSIAVVTSVMALDNIRVEGGKISWDGTLASGWIGGNARQIERLISRSDNPDLVTIMREMLLDAQRLDVYFTHLDVTGVSSGTLTTIRVNATPQHFRISDMAERKEFWKAYAKMMEDDAGVGSMSILVEDHVARTGGYQAYGATIKITLARGGGFYKLVHLVEIENNTTHIFELKADFNKIRSREKEFNDMLFSLNYR